MGGAGICLGPRNGSLADTSAHPIGIHRRGSDILTRTLTSMARARSAAIRTPTGRSRPCKPRRLRAAARARRGPSGVFALGNLAGPRCISRTRGRLASAPVSGRRRAYYRRLLGRGRACLALDTGHDHARRAPEAQGEDHRAICRTPYRGCIALATLRATRPRAGATRTCPSCSGRRGTPRPGPGRFDGIFENFERRSWERCSGAGGPLVQAEPSGLAAVG